LEKLYFFLPPFFSKKSKKEKTHMRAGLFITTPFYDGDVLISHDTNGGGTCAECKQVFFAPGTNACCAAKKLVRLCAHCGIAYHVSVPGCTATACKPEHDQVPVTPIIVTPWCSHSWMPQYMQRNAWSPATVCRLVLQRITPKTWLDKAPLDPMIANAPIVSQLPSNYKKIAALADGGFLNVTQDISTCFTCRLDFTKGVCTIETYLNDVTSITTFVDESAFGSVAADATSIKIFLKEEEVEPEPEQDDCIALSSIACMAPAPSSASSKHQHQRKRSRPLPSSSSASDKKFVALDKWFASFDCIRPGINMIVPIRASPLIIIIKVPWGKTGVQNLHLPDMIHFTQPHLSPLVYIGNEGRPLQYVALKHNSEREANATLGMLRQFYDRDANAGKRVKSGPYAIEWLMSFFNPQARPYEYRDGIIPGDEFATRNPNTYNIFTDLLEPVAKQGGEDMEGEEEAFVLDLEYEDFP
jgi:hypothetical protein